MSAPTGYNPMRYDCDQRGCFNKKRRPKIELFADCFPGKISFGDVDAIVEVNGHALMLEWKSETNKPTGGQHIMYTRLTESSPVTVFLIVGNAETMDITHFGKYHAGNMWPIQECDFAEAKRRIAVWSEWAQKTPVGSFNTVKSKILELVFAAGLRRETDKGDK
jgi:hypothetical protein